MPSPFRRDHLEGQVTRLPTLDENRPNGGILPTDLVTVVTDPTTDPVIRQVPVGSLGSSALNVKAFGAIGDGVTDDTAAIQRAIDAAEAGGVVLLPSGGDFRFSRVTVNAAIAVRIDGTATLIGHQYQVNPPTLFIVTADEVVVEGSGTLRGPGQFDHSIVADIARIPSLIRLTNVERVTVRGLTFVDGPQACVIFTGSDNTTITDNLFIGGDTVANNTAGVGGADGINYYAIYGYESDFGTITNNRITDDDSGNTFAEGMFLYFCNHTTISGNFAKNVCDHDVYLYHSSGDTSPVNNYNVVTGNTSFTTLTNGTQKIGSSYKVHGRYNLIAGNNILNTTSGIVLEDGAFSTIDGNVIAGFNTEGIIVSDLVAANATGLNYITVSNNTLQGAAGANTYGIYFRGDPTFSTANAVGGKITGNTIVRTGHTAGDINAPISLFHSNASYFMDGFLVANNVIVGQQSVFGVYANRVRFSQFTDNIVKDGTYTAWRGFRLDTDCTFNTLARNIVRDDQGTPLLAIGCSFGAASDTDNVLVGNTFHSLYASRDLNPWGLDAALRITGDRNAHDDTLGYPVALSTAEATASITASASVVISTAVPAGARIVGVQLRVDSALAGGDTWDAAYSGGSTQSIASAQAVVQNTKVNALYDTNAASDIAASATNVTITKNGGGSFTAQGVIRALVYYESLTTLGSL